MQDYMERAAALVHSYVPPSPSQIQAGKDGALYAAQTTLDAKAKNIQVVITNSGHKPVVR